MRTVYAPLGAALLDDLDRLCAEGWKPKPRPLTLPCERCGRPSTHRGTHQGNPLPKGWRVLCCADSDRLMFAAGHAASDDADRLEGWASWVAWHAEQCGPRALRDLREA